MVDHNPVPDQVPGLAGFKQWMSTARRSFPDLHGTVGHVLAEGDLVASPGAAPFAGVAPTGQFVVFEAYHIARFEDGIVAEWWGTADIFGALAQLGVLPWPDKACVLSSLVARSPR
jgi:predicted ester cyclase